MQALCGRFSSKGNSTRKIVEADRMKKYLHYKNERSLSFEMFLNKCRNFFNIYDKEGELMLEDVKLRFLLDRTQNAYPQVEVDALKENITTGTPVT